MTQFNTSRSPSWKIVIVSSFISVLLGLTVLMGWYLHNLAFIQILPAFVPMQYNTALGFVLCGGGLIFLLFSRNNFAMLFGIGVILLAGLTLFEYWFEINLHIDQLLMEHYVIVKTSHPGRMAPNSAVCFLMTGMAILSSLRSSYNKNWLSVVGVLGALVLSLGMVALFGYPFNLETAYGWGNLTQMAIHTAFGFIIVGAGLIAVAWHQDVNKSNLFPDWFPSLVGIGMVAITVSLWQAYYAIEHNSGSPLDSISPQHAHDALLLFGLILSCALTLTVYYFQIANRRMIRLQEEQKLLRISEQKFLKLFMGVSIPLCFVNKTGIFVHINHRFTKLLGYTLADVPTLKEWWLLAYPNEHYRQWVQNTWSAAVKESIENCVDIMPIEYDVTCKNGDVKTILIGGVVFGDDLLATLIDLTERKQSEIALKKSEDRFRSLVESTADWIWECDTQANFNYVSPQVVKILGYSPDEMLKSSVFDFMAPEDAQIIHNKFLAFAAKAAPFDGIIYVALHKDGRRITLESSGHPFFDNNGKILGYRGIDRDITERRKMEESLRLAKERAEESTRAKSAFLSAMSHEIRTPMNAILGMGEMLKESHLNSEQSKFLQVLTHSGENLLSLINDILDLSKVEAGQLIIESLSFDLHELIRGTCHILEDTAHTKGILLNSFIKPNCPQFVTGDPQRLRQIMLNLIGNAVKFTENGDITVTAGSLDQDYINFMVTDTGIGIEESQLERIFEPFKQADDSTSRRFGGTGLGLSICKQLVEAMGGRIQVESEVGKGSVFSLTVYLPDSSQFMSASESRDVIRERVINLQNPNNSSDDPVMNILLVDDAEDNRMVIRAFLARMPYILTEAINGAEGVKMVQANRFDLILMDIQMPILDGLQATTQIRQWENKQGLKPTPIVALTANAMKEDLEKTTNVGCNLHLSKPVRKANLLNIINQFRVNPI